MNFAFVFLFLLIQVVINRLCAAIFPSNLFGYIASSILSAFIISFLWSYISLPPTYRKDFLKQKAFHKNMIIMFLVFVAIDVVSIFIF